MKTEEVPFQDPISTIVALSFIFCAIAEYKN
jgi:hypothetical protein